MGNTAVYQLTVNSYLATAIAKLLCIPCYIEEVSLQVGYYILHRVDYASNAEPIKTWDEVKITCLEVVEVYTSTGQFLPAQEFFIPKEFYKFINMDEVEAACWEQYYDDC